MGKRQSKQAIKNEALNKINRMYGENGKISYCQYCDESSSEQRDDSVEHVLKIMNDKLSRLRLK